jgi:hypothetical protein
MSNDGVSVGERGGADQEGSDGNRIAEFEEFRMQGIECREYEEYREYEGGGCYSERAFRGLSSGPVAQLVRALP